MGRLAYPTIPLGSRIGRWASFTGVSFRAVGRACGVSHRTVFRWDASVNETPVRHLPAIAHAFGITVDELLHRHPANPVERFVEKRQARADLDAYWRERGMAA